MVSTTAFVKSHNADLASLHGVSVSQLLRERALSAPNYKVTFTP